MQISNCEVSNPHLGSTDGAPARMITGTKPQQSTIITLICMALGEKRKRKDEAKHRWLLWQLCVALLTDPQCPLRCKITTQDNKDKNSNDNVIVNPYKSMKPHMLGREGLCIVILYFIYFRIIHPAPCHNR